MKLDSEFCASAVSGMNDVLIVEKFWSFFFFGLKICLLNITAMAVGGDIVPSFQ